MRVEQIFCDKPGLGQLGNLLCHLKYFFKDKVKDKDFFWTVQIMAAINSGKDK